MFVLVILASIVSDAPNGDTFYFPNRVACEDARDAITTAYPNFRDGIAARNRTFCIPALQQRDA